MTFAMVGWAIFWFATLPKPTGPRKDEAGVTIDEARNDRLIKCQVAIMRDMDDPESADFPNFLIDTSAYHQRPDDNPLDGGGIFEDFVFRAKNRFGGTQKFYGECAYDKNGKLVGASAT